MSLAIAHGEIDAVKRLMETGALDVNGFLDEAYRETVVMAALSAYAYHPEEEDRLVLLRWLLEKGANPSIRGNAGYNCLHMAAQHENLVEAMTLFLEFNPDINIADSNGANVLYWAIQGFPWRTTGEVRAAFLQNLETIIVLGGDLDQKNRHGVTPRIWLERTPQDVRELVTRAEASRTTREAVPAEQPEIPTNLAHPDIAKKIWAELVPPSGPATTVQGQLLRAVEKLRDEAQRNGNVNFIKDHKRMAEFVRDTLVESNLFDRATRQQIKDATRKLTKATRPYIDDDVYDFLVDQVCVFYMKNPALLAYAARDGEL